MPPMRAVLLTAVSTAGLLLVITVILFCAFSYFDGWAILGAVVGQVAFLVLIAYLIRWQRYPGIYQSKSPGKLICEVSLATFTFTGGLLIFALLAKLHILRFLNTDELGHWLGLEFKFKKGQWVKVSGAAPTEFLPGVVGEILNYRVVGNDDFRPVALEPVGTVIYAVDFKNVVLEIPEHQPV
jgi:hypothetical protein